MDSASIFTVELGKPGSTDFPRKEGVLLNPLKKLGVDTDRLNKIPKAKRVEFLTRYVRLLSQILHPDAGGDRKDFQSVREAWEEANSSKEELDACIEQHLKAGRTKKVVELEKALLEEQKLNEFLRERMKEWWFSHAFSDTSKELTVFNLPVGTRILVIDIYYQALVHWAKAWGGRKSTANYEYKLTATGLSKQVLDVIYFKTSDQVPEFETGYGSIEGNRGWHLVKKGEPTDVPLKLIGSSSREIRGRSKDPKWVLQGLTGPEISDQMRTGLTWLEFETQVPKITPKLVKYNSLIANDGENFHILGNIMQITLP